MTKPDRTPSDVKIVDNGPAVRVVENLPSTAGEISALASAHAPFVFFDEVSFCSSNAGIAGVTLAAVRQIAGLPNRAVASDRVIVAHLRASLTAMLALRDMINEVERMANEQAAAAIAAAEAGSPNGLPH